MHNNQCVQLKISGIVQGVGFRPFIYNLALDHKLNGWVKNTSSGLVIEVEGLQNQIESFISHIKMDAPPLANIDQISVEQKPPTGYSQFKITNSETQTSAFQPISPDITVCSDCLNELFDPKNRRFRYPFINCTNCGPRFTIIHDIPYDRPKTSMSIFKMCSDCESEYNDPSNRRFHAQPIACPKCGPKVWLEQYKSGDNGATTSVMQIGEDAIHCARNLLVEGKIIAIKGLGGFHLACNAKNRQAVAELRRRKLRVDKPFAVMMADVETVLRHCHVNENEKKLLESYAHPIVLLRRRSISLIAGDIAPGQRKIGVMLPYTPLHALLLEKEKGYPEVLVMTSGNLSDEPICTVNIDARERLANIADAFLMHDRDIHIRTDDSVMSVYGKDYYPIRRSRGYAPYPVLFPWRATPLLATGAELKNTFCVTNNSYAFLSHHIGDLQNYDTLKSFENGIEHFQQLFRVKPEAIICDKHPDYLSTRYAQDRSTREGIPLLSVQHHHAHIAALMAEQGFDGSHKIIGVVFDGTGYGDDGAIWGGEFLLADYSGFLRIAHMKYFPLPGGDAAIRRPSRIAMGLLHALEQKWDGDTLAMYSDLSQNDYKVIRNQLEKNINSPLTSSVGRLFDAVAAISGVCQKVNYEAQAAIEFEALADPDEKGYYNFDFETGIINPKPAIEEILLDYSSGASIGRMSGKFHNGLAQMVVNICKIIRKDSSISEVGLSGGVWQNITLLKKTVEMLEYNGFTVYIHRKVPANDGGIALGQAAIGAFQLKN